MTVISIDFNLFWLCSPLHCGSASSSGPTVIEQWLFSLHLSMEAMEDTVDPALPIAAQLYFASLILQKQNILTTKHLAFRGLAHNKIVTGIQL